MATTRCASGSDVPKSTLTRNLVTLHGQQLVWQRLADGAFLPSYTLQEHTRLDDADWLGEIASPVLARCAKVQWPSVLSVPRLDYMEVLETSSRRAYFDELPPRPIRFRANMLRSASGRAYSRSARTWSGRRCWPGCASATCPATNSRTTQRRCTGSCRPPGGVGTACAADFGGDYAKTRAETDDGRNSIAMPIQVNGQVLGCVNLTWRMSVLTVQQVTSRHLAELRAAAAAIGKRAAAVGVGVPARWEQPERN